MKHADIRALEAVRKSLKEQVARIDRVLKANKPKKRGGFTVRMNVKPQKDTRNAKAIAEAKATHAGKGKKRSDTL